MSSPQPPDDSAGTGLSSPPSSADSAAATFHFPPLPDDYTRIVERPSSVSAGCLMAGLGGAVGFVIGLFLLSLSADSPALNGLPPVDRADTAESLGLVGAISVVWCPVVMIAAYFAYRGARWAAWTLVGMAAVYVVASFIGSQTGSSATPGGIGLIWALTSAALVYATRPAWEWFQVMRR